LQVRQAIVTLGAMKMAVFLAFFCAETPGCAETRRVAKSSGAKWRSATLCLLVALSIGLGACTQKQDLKPRVRVLTYSSLGAKGGFLAAVADDFHKETSCALEIESTLGATQIISMLSDRRIRDSVDAVMGVDEILAERLQREWEPNAYLEPGVASRLVPILKDRVRPGWLPLDYGALTFIYRKSELSSDALPRKLQDLTRKELHKKFIVQDPRASSPGMMFFLFAERAMPIRNLNGAWLTLAPSWDSSYKMFLAGDAPMVWSYLSSLAYHASQGELDRYGAVDFEEGLPLQVEGMAILKQNRVNPCLKKWVEFVLKPSVLARLAEKQWMWPAMKDVALPAGFEKVPAIRKAAPGNFEVQAVDRLLSDFGKDLRGEGN